jgi:hypothetical protein
VEVIDDQLGVRQSIGQPTGVAGVGVKGDGPDGRQPRRRPGGQPVGNPLRGAAFDHIQESVAVQVDEAGDQQGRVLGGGGEERMLIDAERAGSAEPG